MFANKPILAMLAILALSSYAHANVIGTSWIHVPAVLSNQNLGTLTLFNLTVTNGNGNVLIDGPTSVGQSTVLSAQTAVAYATSYLGLNQAQYNFTYVISDTGSNVSGPSGGLAFTVLAISALDGKPLASNFTLTGTISSDGTVGPVGGVYDKANAAEFAGMRFILVPYVPSSTGGTFYSLVYYIINRSIGIPVVEVQNVSQAIPYALGQKKPTQSPFTPPITFPTQALNQPNLNCTDCNTSYFDQVLQTTFNITQSEINGLPSSYSDAKGQMLSSLNNYMNISNDGYLYVSADLTYLLYINAFLLANHNNVNASSAYATIKNISSYCHSLTPPQLTNINYEFVVGGEVRQTWANITLNTTLSNFNVSSNADQILGSVYSAAPALGWCLAANKMYNVAAAMNGIPVAVSQKLVSQAQAALVEARATGVNQYSASASQDFSEGMYAASLYNSEYALAFSVPVYANASDQELINLTNRNIANATFGTWPYQFSISSQFYILEANASTNPILKSADLASALSTSRIALGLDKANHEIATSLVQEQISQSATSQSQFINIENQILFISQELSYVLAIILFIAGITVAILVCMIYLIMKKRSEHHVSHGNHKAKKRR